MVFVGIVSNAYGFLISPHYCFIILGRIYLNWKVIETPFKRHLVGIIFSRWGKMYPILANFRAVADDDD